MNSCVVLGIDHKLQRRDVSCKDGMIFLFFSLLNSLTVKHSIVSIVEEFSVDALSEARIKTTTVQDFAASVSIAHSFCDPGIKDRIRLGIKQEGDILVDKFLDKENEVPMVSLLFDSDVLREKFWLDVVLRFNKFPMLFICGESHVDSIANLFKNANISVIDKIIFKM